MERIGNRNKNSSKATKKQWLYLNFYEVWKTYLNN